ncbi:aspartate aminotransferase family protein [Steroidobacter cummioxidans]|uniref:aspartate aminotransferase family protein n=1 Tax=Steroidobacter cummioxidans TaxID=1803913 RepID=UPI000E31EF2B|nr:aspartate aminotransferase family protein [Steroidobacter cummioxidans]
MLNPEIANNDSPSAALYARARAVMPGGCSRNTVLRKPHPLYAARGEGCYLIDIDGNRYVDFANNMAALIHGHAAPAIVAAVTEQLKLGTGYTMATEVEVEYAEYMCARVPSFDKIRFVNSGTEAVMCALKSARAFTGRSKIAKVEGSYHGVYDYAEISQTSQPANWGSADHPASVPVTHGTPSSALNDVVVIPFNDLERAIAILDAHADELACILLDLVPHRVGMILANPKFVAGLREWSTRNNVLLVLDEVITLRCRFGGAQEIFKVKPDLTAMGKLIGGGFPVGALAGRDDVMSVMDPLSEPVRFPHSGTFSANPITMVAGLTAMRAFDRAAVARLNELGDRARARLTEAIRIADAPACVTGVASLFRIHMKQTPPLSYRDTYESKVEKSMRNVFVEHMLRGGMLLTETGAGMLSTAMTDAEIDALADVAVEGFRKVKCKIG